MLNEQRLLASSFLAQQNSGASDHQKKSQKKRGITRPCPNWGKNEKLVIIKISFFFCCSVNRPFLFGSLYMFTFLFSFSLLFLSCHPSGGWFYSQCALWERERERERERKGGGGEGGQSTNPHWLLCNYCKP